MERQNAVLLQDRDGGCRRAGHLAMMRCEGMHVVLADEVRLWLVEAALEVVGHLDEWRICKSARRRTATHP